MIAASPAGGPCSIYFVPFIGWLWILIECGFLPVKPGVTYTFNAAPAAMSSPAVGRQACVEACRQRAPVRDRRGRGFMLYKFALDPNAQIFTDLTGTFAR